MPLAGLLDEIVDARPPLAVILAEHVVIGAANRHAGTLDRDHGLGAEFVEQPLRFGSRLIVRQRVAERDGDTAEAAVRRGALCFIKRDNRKTGGAKRGADRFEKRRVGHHDRNSVESVTQRARQRGGADRTVGLADLHRHPGPRQRARDQHDAITRRKLRQGAGGGGAQGLIASRPRGRVQLVDASLPDIEVHNAVHRVEHRLAFLVFDAESSGAPAGAITAPEDARPL